MFTNKKFLLIPLLFINDIKVEDVPKAVLGNKKVV